jgi:hypothetical protein
VILQFNHQLERDNEIKDRLIKCEISDVDHEAVAILSVDGDEHTEWIKDETYVELQKEAIFQLGQSLSSYVSALVGAMIAEAGRCK